jgi:hypothetical protein
VGVQREEGRRAQDTCSSVPVYGLTSIYSWPHMKVTAPLRNCHWASTYFLPSIFWVWEW